MVDLSCRDWFEKIKAGKPPLPDNLPLDQAEAAAAITVFDKLRLPDVPGKPLLRDVSAQWARDFVGAIFGLVELNEDRSVVVNRTVRKFFQLVPKKNSKTTNGAAIMMTALLRNRRPNAEFLLVGPTQETAGRAYDQASGMVAADPWLKKRFHARDHLKLIEDRKNGSKLKILSFDNRVMTGAKPVGVLIDELHELGKVAYAQKVMTQIEGGIIANAEGFVIIITTQSDEPPAGVFKQELEHARAVRDGEYEGGETLPMLYEFPVSMQADESKPWEDPKFWPLVLPNLGRSITIDRLLPKFRENKAKGVEAYSVWASQHLNVEIGIAITGTGWRGAHYWLAGVDESLRNLDRLLDRSEVAVIGVDGGGLDDLLGLAVIGRCKTTRKWLHWSHAWCQRDVLDLRKDIAPKLEEFDGLKQLTICDDTTADIMGVAEICERIHQAGLLPESAGIGFDPQGVAAIVDELAARGMESPLVVSVSQGFRLSPAVWGLERKLKDGTFVHGGQALMAFSVGNAKVVQRGNAVVVEKQTSGKAKIDPLIATFTAAMLMSRNPEAQGNNVSVYELIAQQRAQKEAAA
jgi:phage terminase large subunit-like protein